MSLFRFDPNRCVVESPEENKDGSTVTDEINKEITLPGPEDRFTGFERGAKIIFVEPILYLLEGEATFDQDQ